MNRIILIAQLLGALFFTIAAVAIADPTQDEVRRLKVAESDSLQGRLKWGDIVLKARAIEPVGGRTLSRGETKAAPVQLALKLEWESMAEQKNLRALTRVLDGEFKAQPGELTIRSRTVKLSNALITEIGFPALDGASKEPAYVSLKLDASLELTPSAKDGKPVELRELTPKEVAPAPAPAPVPVPYPNTTRTWLPSNFRLTIDGLDTRRVRRLAIAPIAVGNAKGGQRRQGETTLGDFVLSKADFLKAAIVKWEGPDFDASKNEIRSRAGKIVYFDTNGRVLAALKFRLVGLGRLKTVGSDAQVELRLADFELTRN